VSTFEQTCRLKWCLNRNTMAICDQGFRRRRTLIPKGTRTAFRAEGERLSERSDAGISIVQEVFGFVKEKPVRSAAEEERR
jgi:hypothetical protein